MEIWVEHRIDDHHALSRRCVVWDCVMGSRGHCIDSTMSLRPSFANRALARAVKLQQTTSDNPRRCVETLIRQRLDKSSTRTCRATQVGRHGGWHAVKPQGHGQRAGTLHSRRLAAWRSWGARGRQARTRPRASLFLQSLAKCPPTWGGSRTAFSPATSPAHLPSGVAAAATAATAATAIEWRHPSARLVSLGRARPRPTPRPTRPPARINGPKKPATSRPRRAGNPGGEGEAGGRKIKRRGSRESGWAGGR
ncbi:unnamed protein product [Lampetra fluviatilis]